MLDNDYVVFYCEVILGDYVMICVLDIGIGMSVDMVSYVFEFFFIIKLVGKGSGFGLSMVFGFMK